MQTKTKDSGGLFTETGSNRYGSPEEIGKLFGDKGMYHVLQVPLTLQFLGFQMSQPNCAQMCASLL